MCWQPKVLRLKANKHINEAKKIFLKNNCYIVSFYVFSFPFIIENKGEGGLMTFYKQEGLEMSGQEYSGSTIKLLNLIFKTRLWHRYLFIYSFNKYLLSTYQV